MRRLLSIAVAALAAVSVIFARGGMQAPEAEQPAEKKLIDLKSDNMGPVAPGDSVIFLVGNFAAQHNGAVITCDSAVRYSDMRIEFFGNVLINKNTTYIYGDRAEYNGEVNEARVFSDIVKVVDEDATLYTYEFLFNTKENVGEFGGGGVLVNRDSRLESVRGYYYANSKELVCVDRVEMRNDEYELKGDSVVYNMATDNAFFFKHTNIWNKEGDYLYADRGAYRKADSLYKVTSNGYVLTDKQEDKLRRAEVDAAREEVTREIEGSDAQPQPPAYQYPPITLLKEGSVTNAAEAGAELRNNSRRLAQTLTSFGVDAQPGDVVRGPSVTRYEFTLSQGVKLSKITNLQDDIALALGASGVRIAPIPDKISVVGVEVPNKLVSPVSIRTVLESTEFTTHPSTTAFAVGKDISGKNIVGNISKLPHVLIAGTTGSGKSVCTNSLIVSMLYKSTPEEVRFIMVDPKMVELAPYNGIPHLLIPVVTDPKKAAGALQWAVYEMMKRYKMFSEHNVKDLASYNKVAETDETLKKLPSVVVVIDELADLMLVAAKEVEESICRVAQMGRAAGMHLVIATQRPSADVITGLMKANIPSRIAFAVASAMESRIILDTAGAEKLVGRGDMLYAPLGEGKPKRVQGCFISSEEIERVVNFVKENGETDYDESVIDKINAAVAEKEKGSGKGGGNAAPDQNAADEADELLPAAIDVVMETGQASVSMLQRRLKLGYSRAARIVDEMETRGIVGPFEGSKPRQLLITKEQWQELKMKGAYGAVPPEAEELPPPDEEN